MRRTRRGGIVEGGGGPGAAPEREGVEDRIRSTGDARMGGDDMNRFIALNC